MEIRVGGRSGGLLLLLWNAWLFVLINNRCLDCCFSFTVEQFTLCVCVRMCVCVCVCLSVCVCVCVCTTLYGLSFFLRRITLPYDVPVSPLSCCSCLSYFRGHTLAKESLWCLFK